MTDAGRRAARGFTLLEVLVVLLIIGVMLTFASLSIDTGVDRRLETEAKRLYALMDMAGEEAVLSGRPLFVQLFRDGYRFVEPNAEGDEWIPIEGDKQLRPRELPPGMHIELTLDGSASAFADSDKAPVIGFFASGELGPPFSLSLVTEDDGSYAVEGDIDGRLVFTRHALREGQ